MVGAARPSLEKEESCRAREACLSFLYAHRAGFEFCRSRLWVYGIDREDVGRYLIREAVAQEQQPRPHPVGDAGFHPRHGPAPRTYLHEIAVFDAVLGGVFLADLQQLFWVFD